MNKWVIGGIVTALLVAFLVWLFNASSKPLTGTKQADLGRKHVTSLASPSADLATSGDHYENWIRAGVYETPQDDGNLIHSLEHGYVVMSYRCSEQLGKTQQASESASEFSEECRQIKDQLKGVYEKKGKDKLIIVPRPQMDTKITLSAWNYMDKLDLFDEQRIENFIDSHRDQGPEKTKE
ncbi:DUF3105 domain-containing protein [Candidatus Daviesbacteria bacterium]|nr:DUF3105 domain-containing protein [Candidatus Daviesbacteria bacterium]